MLKLAVTLAIVASALAVNLDNEWAEYKRTYAKVYNKAEEVIRRSIWESHHEYIQKHNEGYKQGLTTFYLGANEYMDMSNEEFSARMNGYAGRPARSNNLQFESTMDVKDLPATVDWRTKGYVTPVKNQAQCGSCWAFSTTGSLEGQWFKKTNKLVSLSEQNLVDCAKKEGNHGCEGGLMDDAFKYIKDNNGIDTEESYPYTGQDGSCHFKVQDVGANLTGFVDVKSKDENALQQASATIGPISVAIDANHMAFQLYAGGVYHNWFCSENNLDHGVLVVGYGTDSGKDYWMVKNSWGPSWGLKGYIMMSRNRRNNCGIATQASYPTV